MDLENLMMEMVMGSTRRDRAGEAYPHPAEELLAKHRRPRLRDRRRSRRAGPRIEPRLRAWREQGGRREGGLVATLRKLLKRA